MKKLDKIPAWVVAVTLSAVVLVVLLVGWRSLNPNDPALDGHKNKIFTPEDIARFRSQDNSRRDLTRARPN